MAIITVLIKFVLVGAWAQPAFDHQHQVLTKALQSVVRPTGSGTSVDFGLLKKRPQNLILYLKRIARVRPKQFATFTPDQKKAFLVNAYNGFALQIIKDNYPLQAVNKMQGLKDPWGLRFIRLLGKECSLNDIAKMLAEHKDPRLMLAITTSAASSPPLRAEAYTAANLNEQLDEQARIFLRDTSRNRLDFENKVLKVSSVFKRFKSEFEKDGMTLQKFVAPFVSDDAKVREELANGLYNVEHLEPDWKLNKLSK